MVRERRSRRTRLNGRLQKIKKIDDPGGIVVSVEVRVNGILRKKREAVLGAIDKKKTFKTDDSEYITIRKNSSFERIAARLLLSKGERSE